MDRLLQKVKRFISKYILRRSALDIWRKRAKQYGVRAVLNLGHSENEVEAVTQMQKETIFPIFKQELLGDEKTVLDLGCGPGRFTCDLAEIIKGQAIGVDPIEDFLEMAPRKTNVEYRLMNNGSIPAEDKTVDVVWICLVLGGVVKSNDLRKTAAEVNRILKPGGLVALIENTSDAADGDYWKFRSVAFYQSLFNFVGLKHLSDYYDLGERISIMMGRKSK